MAIGDGLHDGDGHFLPCIQMAGRSNLGHHDADDILHRIDEEDRAPSSAPGERAGRSRITRSPDIVN